MATTIPELVETSDPPLSTDSDAQFDAKAFPWAASLNPFGQSVSEIAIAARENAEEALAAALGGDLPPLTGEALKFLRVKADESGAEFAEIPEQPTADWEAGTSTTEGIVSPAKVKAATDVRFYHSSGQTITSGGSLTLAHGLGENPKLMTGYLKCLSAEGGYSVGDEVIISLDCHRPGEVNPQGVSIRFDDTNIYVRYGSGNVVFVLVNNTNGDRAILTSSNWDFYVRAFK